MSRNKKEYTETANKATGKRKGISKTESEQRKRGKKIGMRGGAAARAQKKKLCLTVHQKHHA